MACKICETRRPRRFCPGVGGDICAVCCGTEREVSVSCPLDCEYLQQARQHEHVPSDAAVVPNPDIRITERFLLENETLMGVMARSLFEAAMRTPGATDFDVREALEALIRTHRTLQSGLYYETRPDNPLAANIMEQMQQAVEEFRKKAAEQSGIHTIRDADVLGMLVFLHRLERQHNNGRKRGRALIDFMRGSFGDSPQEETGARPVAGSPLILP